MTIQEEYTQKQKALRAIEMARVAIHKAKPSCFRSDEEYIKLSEQWPIFKKEFDIVARKLYLESLNCKKCEDSGMLNQCCSDENCQGNVICYDCEYHEEL